MVLFTVSGANGGTKRKEEASHDVNTAAAKKLLHRFLHHLALGELPNISGLGFLTCKTRPLEILREQYLFKLILI